MRSLLRSTLIVSVCNAAVQAVNFLTQVLVARQFGASAELDGYWVAAAVTQFVSAVGVTAVSLAFVPELLARLSTEGEQSARRLTTSVIFTLSLALLLASSLAVVWRVPVLRLLAPGLNETALRAAGSVATVLWPSIALSGIVQIQVASLQGRGRFTGPALIAVAGASAIAGLIALLGPTMGIMAFAVATAAGPLLQVLFLCFLGSLSLRRAATDIDGPGVRRVLALAWPLFVSALLSGAAPLLERYLASRTGVGSISHLAYASRIVTAEMLFISTGLAAVLFPRLALSAALRDQLALGRLLSTSIRLSMLVLVPLCLMTAVLAHPLVTVAFQRGSFGPADSARVARILQVYALALPPMALGALVGRAMYSMRANRIVALMAGGYLTAYWLLASWLSSDWGVEGLAISTAVCLMGGFLVGLGYVRRHTPGECWAGFAGMIARTSSASLAMAIVMFAVRRSFVAPLIALSAAAATGTATYLAVLVALRSRELHEIHRQLVERRRASVAD